MRILRLLLLPATLLLCGADVPERPSTISSTTLMGLTLTVSVATRHAIGEPISAHVTLVNGGSKRLKWARGPAINCSVKTWRGNEVPPTEYARNDGTDYHPLSLGRDQTITVERDLSKWAKLQESGAYTLVVRVPFFSEDKQYWGEAQVVVPFFIGNPPFPVKPDEGGV